MGISFLTPLILAGLAALAVPVIVHLTQSARKNVVPFPSLMFVRQIPFRSVRRQRIRHWLLFTLRCLAVVLLVAAFARPLLEGSTEAVVALSRAREVVILIDRSYSMGYGDHWERALEAGRRAIDGVGPDDRATLVLFADRAEVLNQRTADRATLHARLATAELGSGTTRYAGALEVARGILERSDRPRGEVVLISDFQKAGWDASEVLQLPQRTILTSVDLSAPDPKNISVQDVTLERDPRPGGDRVTISALIANHGSEAADDVELSLELEGESVQSQAVSIAARNSVMIRFEPISLPQRVTAGAVRTGGDALSSDDVFRFVAVPSSPISVLVVQPNEREGGGLYLQQVLSLGNDPVFELEVKRGTRLTRADLASTDVIVLNDVPLPGGEAGRGVRDFVREGGGLLLVLGRRTPPSVWPASAEELLPGTIGAPVDRSAEGGSTLSTLDYDHAALEIFSAPRSGDFTMARFFRFRSLQPSEGSRVIARFGDGAAALTEKGDGLGQGRVLVWASDFENFWNDLAVQPVFLPFVHRLVMYLAGYVEPEPWFEVGDVVDLAAAEGGGGEGGGGRIPGAGFERAPGDEEEWVLEEPRGERSVIPVEGGPIFLELARPGFYRVRDASPGSSAEPIYTLAVNLDPSESDLATIDPAELASVATAGGGGGGGGSEAEALAADVAELLTPQERERRQGIWWYLLSGAALLLLAETALSNLTARYRSHATVTAPRP